MNKNWILGVFDDEDKMVGAFEKLLEAGIKPVEVYSPYPVEAVLVGMGKKTRITHAAFLYGFFGALGILGFLYYAAVISWPLNFGGKPFNTFPSFIVVTLVATILTITILTLLTFSVRAKLFPGKAPDIVHIRVTDDKFVMLFEKGSVEGRLDSLQRILNDNGVEEIVEKPSLP